MNNKLKVKMYDLCWIDKQKHILAELKRVVKEHNLENELIPFEKTPEDYKELAEEKTGLVFEDKEEIEEEIVETPTKTKKVKAVKTLTKEEQDEDFLSK